MNFAQQYRAARDLHDTSPVTMMAFHRLRLVVVSLVLLVNPIASGGWWRRRDSSGCRARNCDWGGWSVWGNCNHPCGNAGTQSRSRSEATTAACGGAACSGGSTQSQACNRFCNNGGTPKSGYCGCPDVYWGTCCEYRE